MKKKILLVIIGLLVLIQFIRPGRNVSEGPSPRDIARSYPVSDTVLNILKRSCYDCHSNNTRYPWYTNIQPVGWWMQMHVNDGKEELNFSEFGSYPPKKQAHKMRSTAHELKEDGMPLDSYLWIHHDARLSPAEKETVINWATGLGKQITEQYHLPAEPERPREED